VVGFEKFLGVRGSFDDRLEINEEFKLNIAKIWKKMNSPVVCKVQDVLSMIHTDSYFKERMGKIVRC
jgi:hypothetical protein